MDRLAKPKPVTERASGKGPYYVPEAVVPYQRPDYREKYNMNLGPREAEFQEWLKANPRWAAELNDYDVRGAWWMSDLSKSGKYRKPNHPRFASDSVYHEGQTEGGRLSTYRDQKGERPYFEASPWNVYNMGGPEAMQQYFQQNEPGVILKLPDPAALETWKAYWKL